MDIEKKGDIIFCNEDKPAKFCVTPRILIIGDGNRFPLVRYKDTKWLGLPGGKVKWEEYPEEANLLSSEAFPTLIREVEEECGIDISGYLDQTACLGLAEINVVNDTARQIFVSYTPIFISLAPRLTFENVNDKTCLVRLDEHLPGPLFPDARLSLVHYRKKLGSNEPITPEWLGREKIYFEHRPRVRMLMGPPAWAC